MNERDALDALADALGVHRRYTDGLHRTVEVGAETLVAVCAALGAPLHRVSDAPAALRAHRDALARPPLLPPVVVAWDGILRPLRIPTSGAVRAGIRLESGEAVLPLEELAGTLQGRTRLPPGYHRLELEAEGRTATARVIAAPTVAWRRAGRHRSWGVGTHLAALRSRRSRALADLDDLTTLCRWVGERGGDLVTVLPLLPTFNGSPAEPSPYSPVSRLFWSALILDLGDDHHAVEAVTALDVERADLEVRAAFAARAARDSGGPTTALAPDADDELLTYARFRGAQARLGRNWRDWPAPARDGRLDDAHVDPAEERFHRLAQLEVRRQLGDLAARLDDAGVRLGLDLSVGVHPDGYDPWRWPELFAPAMSVGAPPDPGFPGGQDWGFAPLLPAASRAQGHRYLAACIAHQARLAGVLRIDHVMALNRLYWIPRGLGLHEGTYVDYPTDELFAIVTLESHRNRCEIVGENLGTVPPAIEAALHRHGIVGMSLAIFEAAADEPRPPSHRDMALIGTHDTPTFAGWLDARDVDERVRAGLLDEDAAPAEREARRDAVRKLAETLGGSPDDPADLLERLLTWLGRSASPLVTPWLEDLWLEPDQVNLPGTASAARPNWQRPMGRLLDDVLTDPSVRDRIEILRSARTPFPTAP